MILMVEIDLYYVYYIIAREACDIRGILLSIPAFFLRYTLYYPRCIFSPWQEDGVGAIVDVFDEVLIA